MASSESEPRASSASRPASGEDDPFAHTRMTLGEHLEELRKRLIRGLVAVVVAFIGCWIFQDPIVRWATLPHGRAMAMLEANWIQEAEAILARDPSRPRTDFFITSDPEDTRLRNFDREMIWIAPAENFLFRLKICLYVALIVGAPVLLWQMWLFVSAGLYEKERRWVRVFFPLSLGAFLVGVAFGYFVMVPYAIYFLNKGPLEFAHPSITVGHYLSFFATLCVALGIVFQLPLLMAFLARTGIVDPQAMARFRGHFIVASFVLGAVLTPPDPFTQMLMAVPLISLYEVGLWTSRWLVRRSTVSPAAPEAPA